MSKKVFAAIIFALACHAALASEPLVKPNAAMTGDCAQIMKKVRDWQLSQSSWNSDNSWEHGALFAGVMAAYEATKDQTYLDAARAWAQKYNWKLYGRYPTRHADYHCCAQTYLELFFLDESDPNRYNHAKITNDYIIANPVQFVCNSISPQWWSWCDALFMAPPVLPRLTRATGDYKYIELMHQMWADTQGCLYSSSDHLFYRDWRYFGDKSPNGQNVYWSRGNGWVMGGIVRLLQYLPLNDPKRPQYIELFRQMAVRLADIQPEDGYWRSNLLDPNHYPNPETSGTGFFCYGITWGINQGILDEQTYLPVAVKAWNALVAAVHDDGKLGWVQPTGSDPKPTDCNHSEVFGVGAFLLAGSELHKYQIRKSPYSIDNFEQYLGTNTNEASLLSRWRDGSTNGTGSKIELGDYGDNFMILDYNNYSARYSARADLVFDGNCDLTANKAAILSIWLKGNPANTPGFFYVKLEDANANTALQSLTDPNVVRLNCWSELLFDLKEFTGIDLTRIRRLSIGTNSASPAPAGADRGIVYIDNIMLSAARRSEEKLASDLNGDCIVNAADLKLLFTDWGEI